MGELFYGLVLSGSAFGVCCLLLSIEQASL
jgi:hypothetical protein